MRASILFIKASLLVGYPKEKAFTNNYLRRFTIRDSLLEANSRGGAHTAATDIPMKGSLSRARDMGSAA